MEAERGEHLGGATPDMEANALRGALTKLVGIDPEMPVKRALAMVEIYSGEGLSVKEIANRVTGFSDASARYALRSLGSGWPGKRPGLGLVTERPKMKGDRAGHWVMTTVGRQTIGDVLKAMQAAKSPSQRVQLLLAA